jgi:hypothetical protein
MLQRNMENTHSCLQALRTVLNSYYEDNPPGFEPSSYIYTYHVRKYYTFKQLFFHERNILPSPCGSKRAKYKENAVWLRTDT